MSRNGFIIKNANLIALNYSVQFSLSGNAQGLEFCGWGFCGQEIEYSDQKRGYTVIKY